MRLCERRLADPAERQRRQRHAELRGGEVAVEFLDDAPRHARALLPAAAISASCVGRTLMIANSAATKKPFAMMNSKARSKYQVGMLTEREGQTRYEMGRRPWKRGIVCHACAGRRTVIPEPPRWRTAKDPPLPTGRSHGTSEHMGGGPSTASPPARAS